MKFFSQRSGIIKAKDLIQKESMDKELKVSLWNMFNIHIWNGELKNTKGGP